MIAATMLDDVMTAVTPRVNERSDVLASQLRGLFPGVHITVCSDDDIPPRLAAVAHNEVCNLYYVASGGHCLSLTNDATAATGIVVALCDGDEG